MYYEIASWLGNFYFIMTITMQRVRFLALYKLLTICYSCYNFNSLSNLAWKKLPVLFKLNNNYFA